MQLLVACDEALTIALRSTMMATQSTKEQLASKLALQLLKARHFILQWLIVLTYSIHLLKA